jgi:peptide deformylase
MPDLRLAIHPHPILRYRAKSIARVDKELKGLIAQMFELMYHHQGVGLAASQVELPLRIFVCNPTGHRDEGPELVFINPVLSKPRGIEEQEEGCLSLPGIRAQVKRSKSIWVNGYNAVGQEINQEFSGFLARIIQHETDHLDGVLFLDRLLPERRKDLDTAVETLMEDHLSRQRTGSTPDDSQLMARVPEWEQRYC